EAAAAHAVEAGAGVDPLDPELTEGPLPCSPVAVGVLQRVHHLLVGGPERAALVAVVAPRLLEHGPAVLASVHSALDPCHRKLPSWAVAATDRAGGEPGRGRHR